MDAEKKWTRELAYVVGLIVTDGSLSSDKRHIVFVSKDLQLIETFKKIIQLKNKVGVRKSGYTGKKDCYHIQFGSVVFYKWLCRIGLMPNKSHRLGGIKIPGKYFFDFLRGHFDGDGTCYGFLDRRWKNSFLFYICFSSGSKKHLLWLKERINSYLKIDGYISKLKGKVWKLSFSKKKARKLIKKMYYGENLPCLKRKYRKIVEILKTDNRGKKGRVLELAYS